MEHGKSRDISEAQVDDLYQAICRIQTKTSEKGDFYNRAVDSLDALVDARRERLSDARLSLPTPFVRLLVGGGYLLLAFTLFLDVSDRRYHTVMVGSVGVLIGFSLMLCLSLQYPFGGGIAVSK